MSDKPYVKQYFEWLTQHEETEKMLIKVAEDPDTLRCFVRTFFQGIANTCASQPCTTDSATPSKCDSSP